ncbi:hypothetical protein CDD81_5354 [Ophiocordyceps australis]|uniref:Uncharacterized protein n=1 Tax=Ophiocordyceps australis TaxID=1399860 RepID=A0A2C5Y877_9HYPO|nr:hypothetical protein CDD81_5354 [Ophiocordyceps australis]
MYTYPDPLLPSSVFKCDLIGNSANHLLQNIIGLPRERTPDICGSDLCGTAIVEVLPESLITSISESWNLSHHALAVKINDATRTSLSDYVFSSIEWYSTASSINQRICWQDPIPFSHNSFADMFGALSALITRPDTIDKLPLRFKSLPPGWLAAGQQVCLGPNDLAYEQIKKELPDLREKIKQTVEAKNIRDILDDWAGVIGRGLFHLTVDRYRCTLLSETGECALESNMIRPTNFRMLWDNINKVMTSNKKFCFSLGTIIEKPGEFWIQD